MRIAGIICEEPGLVFNALEPNQSLEDLAPYLNHVNSSTLEAWPCYFRASYLCYFPSQAVTFGNRPTSQTPMVATMVTAIQRSKS